MTYRIVLCGFSEFEYRALRFSFEHPAGLQSAGYEVVDAVSDADFAIVDADSSPAVKGVLQAGCANRSVFIGSSAPAGAGAHIARPIDTNRILRALQELLPPGGATSRRSATQTQTPPSLPSLPSPAASGPIMPPEPRQPAALAPTPTPPAAPTATVPTRRPDLPEPPIVNDALEPPTVSDVLDPAQLRPLPAATARRVDDDHHAAKAAARAKARRARLAQNRTDGTAALREVLVLGPDDTANARLCDLLDRFGFAPAALATLREAARLLHNRPPVWAAVFLDVPLDDAGIALLRELRAMPRPDAHAPLALWLVVDRVEPADRVRIALAGLPEPLLKPLERGDVARALERSGVPFPADARQH